MEPSFDGTFPKNIKAREYNKVKKLASFPESIKLDFENAELPSYIFYSKHNVGYFKHAATLTEMDDKYKNGILIAGILHIAPTDDKYIKFNDLFLPNQGLLVDTEFRSDFIVEEAYFNKNFLVIKNNLLGRIALDSMVDS